MNRRFEIVTIMGVGLLGGSLGLALKERGIASTLRGVGHRQSSLDKALEVGAVDEVYLSVQEAVRDADLVVVCTPAATVPEVLDEVLPVCSPTAVVTDVASTKETICGHARNTWPKPVRFVGSHPMAGSEKFGPEHAHAKLYEGCVTVVEQGNHLDPDAKGVVCQLWRGVGAKVVEMDPGLHDAIVARTSHIPHIMASCIAALAAGKKDSRCLAGPGFRDFTRIADSRPEIWRDICLTNRKGILDGLDELLAQIEHVRGAVSEGNSELLEVFFDAGREARREVLGE